MTSMSNGNVLLIIVTGISLMTMIEIDHKITHPIHAKGIIACQNDLKMTIIAMTYNNPTTGHRCNCSRFIVSTVMARI